MRVKRLVLKNFRMFRSLEIEDPGGMVVLVSPNGMGKSTILEAIVGAHELVAPYHRDDYQFTSKRGATGPKCPHWPEHLPPPLRIGESRAEIELEIEASESEAATMAENGVDDPVGHARFVIEDERYIIEQHADEAAKWLCKYHTPSMGIGFFDYIKPVRYYQHTGLGDIASAFSDGATRGVFTEFHQDSHRHAKFDTFKTYIGGQQLEDFARFRETGEPVDSLSEFCRVFDTFFAPKRFLGYLHPAKGKPVIEVATPFGKHDVNSLSDGEKEMLHIIGHLFRFRDLQNIVLWDTPELHLNAALEGRLYGALQQIAPDNQYWIATHSLEFIDSVPLDNLYVIRPSEDGAAVERASGDDRRAKIAIYRDLGAQIGLQLVSACVVFCEGKEVHADKRHLERLVGSRVPGVTFVAGGGCGAVLSAGSKANALLEQATENGDFLAVVDRDFRSDEEVAAIEAKHQGSVFVWSVHEFENLMMEPEVVYATLEFHDQLGDLASAEQVEEAIKAAATQIRERIAGQWATVEFSQSYPKADRVASAADPLEALLTHAQNLQEKLAGHTDREAIASKYEEKLAEVDRIIEAGQACALLPGKEILKAFLHQQNAGPLEQFVTAAVSIVDARDIEIPEIERLVGVLKEKVGL